MKIKTIESYIKYTTKPYTNILERAEKNGLIVKYNKEYIRINDKNNYGMDLYFYDMKDINKGLEYTIYNY